MADRHEPDLDDALRRGALINALGVVAKVAFPLFFLVVTWRLGAATAGVFALAFFAGEVLRGLAVGGYVDAVTLFASRALRERTGPSPSRVIVASLVTGTAVATILGAATVGLARLGFPDAFGPYPGLADALASIGWSLPAVAVLDIALAATKARLVMHWEVLGNGLVRPAGLVASALVAAGSGTGLHGLMVGYVVTHGAAAAFALAALHRCFPLPAIARELRGAPVPSLHRYAIPQSLNLTLGRYQTRIDAWLLGLFAVPPAALAFYATGALLASTLREVRLVFSTSLGPVAARHHASGDRAALEELLGRISGWTSALVAPAAFALVLFHHELFVALDPAYGGDTAFFLVLLVAPVASCVFGLAGNLLSYCGHSRWSLANAVAVSALNTALSYAAIPRLGLLGAAIGTATAGVALHLAQNFELARIESVRLPFTPLRRPLAGLLLLASLCAIGLQLEPAGRAVLLAAGLALHWLALRWRRDRQLARDHSAVRVCPTGRGRVRDHPRGV